MEVGRLHEGQVKVLLLERMRQRRLASFIDQTEVIELLVYVDKLLYDHYHQNKTHVKRHILANLNLVCACMCIHMLMFSSHCKVHLGSVREKMYLCT